MQSVSLTRSPLEHSANRHQLLPAGHSGRIRYANPQDLPGFPSIGLKENGAAASAAATLGWANQKSPEPWRPDSSSPASAAAASAKDYKMAPMWEAEPSSAGHKAAVLAAGSAQKQHQQPISPQSTWGSSAANLAFRAAKASSSSSHADGEDRTSVKQQDSLRAATGAAVGNRRRSTTWSSPQTANDTYPDQANSAANSLSAATIALRSSMRIPLEEAGAVPYTTMPRQMFTSNPPVKPEVDEQRRADVLHASAVAMAKRMYDQQQKMIDNTKQAQSATAARSSSFIRHGGAASATSTSAEEQPMPYPNLQEAAYRRAQERLAKLHEEHQKTREYQEYYGSGVSGSAHHGSKMGTVRGKLTRRRASSDGDLVDDRKRSQQIRQQMSAFNTNLSKVDEQKRERDRQALLQAAQRNVKAQLEGMDQKLYEERGLVPPSMVSRWEVKAHAAAQARSNARKAGNESNVDLGAGKFMTRGEVDDIAAKRVQPVIDDINRRAEAERERRLTAKLEEERRKEELEREKGREKEIREIHKQLQDQQKEEERSRKAEAKEAVKAKKEEEKAAKAEHKRLHKEEKKEEKRKSREASKPVAADLQKQVAEEDEQDKLESSLPIVDTAREDSRTLPREVLVPMAGVMPQDTATPSGPAAAQERPIARERTTSSSKRRDSSPPLDDEPVSPTGWVRNWLKNKFSRPHNNKPTTQSTEESGIDRRNFIGGAALRREANTSNDSVGTPDSSMREVAFAKTTRRENLGLPATAAPPQRRRSVSSISSDSGEENFVEARDYASFVRPVTPPKAQRTFPVSGSPARESRFAEIID